MLRKRARHLIFWDRPFPTPPSRFNFAPLLCLLACVLICAPTSLCAQEEATGKTVLQSADEGDGGAPKVEGPAPNLGTGNFARSHFRVSVSVREGYDDNVYTANLNPVGSFFTNGNVVVDYKFGSARTSFDLQALGGAHLLF